MGHFQINLPGNRQGDVRWGKVIKIRSFLELLKKKNVHNEQKIAYIIKVESDSEYRFFRSKAGDWSQDADGKLPVGNDETSLAIKEAILVHENTAV